MVQGTDGDDGGNDRHGNTGKLTFFSQAMEDLAGLALRKFKVKHEQVGCCPAELFEALLRVARRINVVA